MAYQAITSILCNILYYENYYEKFSAFTDGQIVMLTRNDYVVCAINLLGCQYFL